MREIKLPGYTFDYNPATAAEERKARLARMAGAAKKEIPPPPKPPPEPMSAEKPAPPVIKKTEGAPLKVADIQAAVCERYEITQEELVGPSRMQEYVWPRYVSMFLAKTLTNKTTPEIGYLTGGRSHSSVFQAVRRVKESVRKNHYLGEHVKAVLVLLGREDLADEILTAPD